MSTQRHKVTFLVDYEHTMPETDLVSTHVDGSEPAFIARVPAVTFTYKAGQVVGFQRKAAARAFAEFHGAVCEMAK